MKARKERLSDPTLDPNLNPNLDPNFDGHLDPKLNPKWNPKWNPKLDPNFLHGTDTLFTTTRNREFSTRLYTLDRC